VPALSKPESGTSALSHLPQRWLCRGRVARAAAEGVAVKALCCVPLPLLLLLLLLLLLPIRLVFPPLSPPANFSQDAR
jgi:hypothetical protein